MGVLLDRFSLMNKKLLQDGKSYDDILLWVIIFLSAFSLIMVFSASISFAQADGGSKWFYLQRQAIFLSAGFVCALAAFQIPMKVWKVITPYILVVAVILLFAVLIPGIGREVNGARRWIPVGPVNIQPSEIYKLETILYIASFITRREEVLHNFKKGLLPVVMIMTIGLTLIMREPDFGSFMMVATIAVTMLFLGGMPIKWFLSSITLGTVLMVVLILIAPYRMQRVTVFLNPWEDPYGKGYQLTHSLLAFGRGEWFGVGLGGSIEKQFYLPEAHTDFIMAVVSEEFGFVGMLALILAYVWIVWRAFGIGMQAKALEQYYAASVAKGIGIWIGVQSFFNIGVNLGLLPTKGLTLPLMSYGGSAVIVMLVAIALLLRIDWENRRIMRGFKV